MTNGVREPEEDEASVRRLLEEQGLRRLAEEKEAILSFPNPRGGKWNYSFEEGENDVAAFQRFQEACNRETEEPMECRANGIPTHEAMMSVWHPMHDVRYLIGTGSGASMACTLAACVARGIAGILAVGGGLCEKARRRSVGVPVAAYLVNCDSGTRNYFRVVNETAEPITEGDIQLYANKRNAGRCVLVEQGERGLEELFTDAWNRLFEGYAVRIRMCTEIRNPEWICKRRDLSCFWMIPGWRNQCAKSIPGLPVYRRV